MFYVMKWERFIRVELLAQTLELYLHVRLWLDDAPYVCRIASEWGTIQHPGERRAWLVDAQFLAGQRLQRTLYKKGARHCPQCGLFKWRFWQIDHPDCARMHIKHMPPTPPQIRLTGGYWPYPWLPVLGLVLWGLFNPVNWICGPDVAEVFSVTGRLLIVCGVTGSAKRIVYPIKLVIAPSYLRKEVDR